MYSEIIRKNKSHSLVYHIINFKGGSQGNNCNYYSGKENNSCKENNMDYKTKSMSSPLL